MATASPSAPRVLVTRRTLAKGAAWATPVVALNATAPANAATIRCESQTVLFSTEWATITDIVGVHGDSSWYNLGGRDAVSNGTWRSTSDQIPNAAFRHPGETYLQYSIRYPALAVQAGCAVQISTEVNTGLANNRANTSIEQRLDVAIGGQTVGRYTTRTQPYSPTLYNTRNNSGCGDTTVSSVSTTRADGYTVLPMSRRSTLTWTYTPTSTGTVPVEFTFTKLLNQDRDTTPRNVCGDPSAGTNNWGNDKMVLQPLVVTCLC